MHAVSHKLPLSLQSDISSLACNINVQRQYWIWSKSWQAAYDASVRNWELIFDSSCENAVSQRVAITPQLNKLTMVTLNDLKSWYI